MVLRETTGDLFSAHIDEGTMLCHCISSDFALGAGIAKQFTARGVKAELFRKYPSNKWSNHGYCLMTSCGVPTANLVTKERYFHKPTLQTMREALADMKRQACAQGVKHIKMPAIGCGLDRLAWADVRRLIIEIFTDTDINVTVFFMPGKART